jgi:hypothetical protein
MKAEDEERKGFFFSGALRDLCVEKERQNMGSPWTLRRP